MNDCSLRLDIRRQLLGFFGLLLIVWMAISSVHPAFEIAHPLVVLLAFAIMALAAFVLFMIIGRFRRYVDENRRRLAQVHDRDISRLSAAYSAFMLGISAMRRRRLRTGLTLATLVLLTFTLLSFATFDTGIRFVALNLDRLQPTKACCCARGDGTNWANHWPSMRALTLRVGAR